MRFLRAVGRFGYDFVIGDDWKIAAAVLGALGAGTVLVLSGVPTTAAVLGTAGLVALAFVIALVVDLRR